MDRPVVSFDMACSMLLYVARSGQPGQLDMLNISQDDYDFVTQDSPWPRDSAYRAQRTLQSLGAGLCQVVGVSTSCLPVEYLAAVIALFCAPCNALVACAWLERRYTSQELSRGVERPRDITQSQLSNLMLRLYERGRLDYAQQIWVQRTRLMLSRISGSEQIDRAKGGDLYA